MGTKFRLWFPAFASAHVSLWTNHHFIVQKKRKKHNSTCSWSLHAFQLHKATTFIYKQHCNCKKVTTFTLHVIFCIIQNPLSSVIKCFSHIFIIYLHSRVYLTRMLLLRAQQAFLLQYKKFPNPSTVQSANFG